MDPARHVDAAMLPITCFISARLRQQSWWLRREEKKALEGSDGVEEDVIKHLNTWLADLHSGLIVVGEGNGTPLQYSCLENPMDRGAWWAAVHGVAKSRTRLSDFTFTFHFNTLEKEIAAHSSVPAWRIPGTAEPGGLPSTGSRRVRHAEVMQQQPQQLTVYQISSDSERKDFGFSTTCAGEGNSVEEVKSAMIQLPASSSMSQAKD